MLTATPDQWRRCADCLTGQPAFILGNCPELPDSLECLDGYFTVGVNRILLRYEPTVLLWMDPELLEDVAGRIDLRKTIPIACDIHPDLPWVNTLEAIGHPERQPNSEAAHPGGLITVGNSGVSAAVWAWSLGCRPVFLLGMSAKYNEHGTNFYGDNPKHHGSTLRQLNRAMKVLRHYGGMVPINSGTVGIIRLAAACRDYRPMGRDWYAEHLAACHAGVDTGQRSDTTVGPVATT